MHTLDVLKYGNLTVVHSVNGLSDAEWNAPDVCGYWSVKQIIAHLASFEYILIDALGVARGEPEGRYLTDWFRDPQEFNDVEVAARDRLSVIETLVEYETTHAKTMELAATLPAGAFLAAGFLPQYGAEYDLEDYITYSFYGHKREHTAQINIFRDGLRP